MNSRYTVAIIGAGRIGAGFDAPDSNNILSHAHAFSANTRTELIGFFDTDPARAAAEAKKWNTKVFSSLDELFAAKPDIVIIASPDETHAALLQQVAAQKPSLIICEKPLAMTEAELDTLRQGIEVPVIVNFRRRFDPVVSEVRDRLGEVISARAVYTKGLLHNGSHMIDLARCLFGELVSSKKLYEVRDWEGDPTVGAYLSFERCPHFFLMTGDARAYDIFDLEVLCKDKRLRFFDEGMRLAEQQVVPDPVYPGYQMLGEAKRSETGLIHAMEQLAQHVVDVLDGKTKPQSDVQNAIKTQDACFALLG